MDIIQIVGLSLAAAVMLIILRGLAPQIAMLLSLCVGTVILLVLVGKISGIIADLERLAITAHVDFGFLQTVLKIMGIAYIAEFGAHLARDAGENALAGKIELAGKVFIVVMAVPILSVVVETMVHLLP